jgi:lipopolysaccharide export system protein LptA
MSRRALLTLATLCILLGMYTGYAALMQPLVQHAEVRPLLPAATEGEAPRPVENVRIASEHLAHQPWTAVAKYHLRSQQAFIYTDHWQPDGNEGRVRLMPFAMAWVTTNRVTGEEQVVTVVSESASVKFAGSFQVSNPNPGRVVSAALHGRSQVAGPNGLVVDGHNFFFSESSSSLYSDSPVKFAYAGNEGNADSLVLDLIPQDGVPGNDRPHVFGVRRVRLSQKVKMFLQLKQQQEPLLITIRSNTFEYDVLERRAVYSKDVVVHRETAPEEFDWIDCDRLTVDFAAPTVAAKPTGGTPARDSYQQLDTRLQFQRLLAESSPLDERSLDERPRKRKVVQLNSIAHQLKATAETLVYDGMQRTLTLRDAKGVDITQSVNRLLAPEVSLQLGEAGRLAGAWCRGAGWLVHREPETSEVVFAADWREELRYQPDPTTGLDVWRLGDSATFRQPRAGTALGADLLTIWTTPPKQESGQKLESRLSSSSDGVQPRRMEAAGNVVLVSPRVEANCQKLEAWLDPAPSPTGEDATGVTTASAQTESPTDDEPTDEPPYHAIAETIRVRLLSRAEGEPELAEIWADTRVTLRQTQPDGQPSRTITGGQVHLQNRGGKDQVVHITGKPAQLRDQGYALEGQSLHLDRAENRVWVDGAGALKLPLKSDLEGKPLAEPQPLDVTWKERMSFDGTVAAFTGQTKAIMGDRQMSCQQLWVTLSDRVSFTERERDAGAVQIASVRCRDNVEFQNFSKEEKQIVEIQKAKVWELNVDRVTGKMEAQGPGWMQMWRRGQGPRAGLVATQSARANSPVEVDPAEWEFTRVKFNGRMDGNLQRRHATFHDRVEIVHGLVNGPSDVISRDTIPKGGGWMRCDELQVAQQAAPDARRGFIQLVGRGNADLEGRGFFAKADEIAYDESKGSYTLRAYGRNKARLTYEKVIGQALSPTPFQRGVFFPETNSLNIEKITGESGQ